MTELIEELRILTELPECPESLFATLTMPCFMKLSDFPHLSLHTSCFAGIVLQRRGTSRALSSIGVGFLRILVFGWFEGQTKQPSSLLF